MNSETAEAIFKKARSEAQDKADKAKQEQLISRVSASLVQVMTQKAIEAQAEETSEEAKFAILSGTIGETVFVAGWLADRGWTVDIENENRDDNVHNLRIVCIVLGRDS